MLVSGYLLQPDKYLLPAYRISPFRTEDVARNRVLPHSLAADDYFRTRFPGRRFAYCENGRQAIHLALGQLGLGPQDVVTILTTTGNFYISGCVTREIEKFCRWSRKIESDTKVLFVNHEFGFPYAELSQLRRFGVPMIEDAAHCFASENAEGTVSRIGDFTVYSLPKFFPVQIGGLLVFDEKYDIAEPIPAAMKHYLQGVVSHYLTGLDATRRKRRANHEYLGARFSALGLTPRFQPNEREVPGVFMFQTEPELDLVALKTFLWGQGIECSVFYGERAFFIPVNERLDTGDMDYFYEAVRYFVRRGGGRVECP